MKNRIPCYVLALLCTLLWGLFACSEDRTAGGTVDGNSIAEVHIDSVKVFADALPAGMDESEIDSTIFWYKINFNGVGEEVFSYEVLMFIVLNMAFVLLNRFQGEVFPYARFSSP